MLQPTAVYHDLSLIRQFVYYNDIAVNLPKYKKNDQRVKLVLILLP